MERQKVPDSPEEFAVIWPLSEQFVLEELKGERCGVYMFALLPMDVAKLIYSKREIELLLDGEYTNQLPQKLNGFWHFTPERAIFYNESSQSVALGSLKREFNLLHFSSRYAVIERNNMLFKVQFDDWRGELRRLPLLKSEVEVRV